MMLQAKGSDNPAQRNQVKGDRVRVVVNSLRTDASKLTLGTLSPWNGVGSTPGPRIFPNLPKSGPSVG